MTFVYPYLFWVLILPFTVFALLISTNKDRLSRIFDEKVLERLSAADDTIPLMVRNIVMFAAIFLMITAMARPVIEKSDKVIEMEGLSLLAALDISGSMRSQDNYPSRLAFAKKKMELLFEKMPGDEIALAAFAHSSFILAPFSSDKATLAQIIDGVNDSYINMGSTDFSALGRLSASMLEKKKPKIAVVFSDGGDPEALEGFADILKESGITLYAVLIGTPEGAPVLDSNGKPVTSPDGAIVITQRNDALGQIAIDTGGAFVAAGNQKDDIAQLVEAIRSDHQSKQTGTVTIKDREELFYYPLTGALALLLTAFGSIPKRRRVTAKKGGGR